VQRAWLSIQTWVLSRNLGMRGYAWLTEIVQVLSMFRVRAGWGRLRSHIWWSLQGPGASLLCFSFRHIAAAATNSTWHAALFFTYTLLSILRSDLASASSDYCIFI
jgi:hypothetical protein